MSGHGLRAILGGQGSRTLATTAFCYDSVLFPIPSVLEGCPMLWPSQQLQDCTQAYNMPGVAWDRAACLRPLLLKPDLKLGQVAGGVCRGPGMGSVQGSGYGQACAGHPCSSNATPPHHGSGSRQSFIGIHSLPSVPCPSLCTELGQWKCKVTVL